MMTIIIVFDAVEWKDEQADVLKFCLVYLNSNDKIHGFLLNLQVHFFNAIFYITSFTVTKSKFELWAFNKQA